MLTLSRAGRPGLIALTRRARAIPGVSIELERLALLHESGGLSDDEFTAAKNRVIGHVS
ncbi:hypothetical protein [Microbacterium alcoholitolerans]|uniref:hypothetical protein n=1 Tax=unclassified Microbacterium TaxID=2609290 RepID=UPI003D170F2A